MGNRVRVKQYIYLGVLFSIGNLYLIIGSVHFVVDYWISFLIGAVMSVPFIFIYSAIQKLYPGQNLFNIFISVFGKVGGKIFTAIFLIYVIYLGATSVRSCSELIKVLNLTKTPIIAIMAFIILLCIMMARCGINIIGKTTLYLFPIIITITITTFFLSLPFSDPTNILPIAIEEKSELFKKCFTSGSITFGEFFVLTTVMTRDKDEKSNFWPLIATLGITALFAVLIFIRNIIVLGHRSYGVFYYPSYESVSVISNGTFLSRIEIFIGIYLIINSIIRISILITSSAEGLVILTGCGSQREMATPAGILVLTLASVIFKSTQQLSEFVIYYPYFSIPFQIAIPIIVLVTALIKTKGKQQLGGQGVVPAGGTGQQGN